MDRSPLIKLSMQRNLS